MTLHELFVKWWNDILSRYQELGQTDSAVGHCSQQDPEMVIACNDAHATLLSPSPATEYLSDGTDIDPTFQHKYVEGVCELVLSVT